MTDVFLGGSLTIKKLHASFLERLEKAALSGLGIIVGDAKGADSAIQQALLDRQARNVTVYCTGPGPRHNLGDWPTHRVTTEAAPGSRAFFAAKDVAMAADAKFGLMVWDAKSPGTLSNVLNLLALEKKCVVYVQSHKDFVTTTDAGSVERLITLMPPEALKKADEKIGLRSRLAKLGRKQIAMDF